MIHSRPMGFFRGFSQRIMRIELTGPTQPLADTSDLDELFVFYGRMGRPESEYPLPSTGGRIASSPWVKRAEEHPDKVHG